MKTNKIKTFLKNHKTELLLGGAAIVLGGVLIYERLVPRTHQFTLTFGDDLGYLFSGGWEEACDYIAENGLKGAKEACPDIGNVRLTWMRDAVK